MYKQVAELCDTSQGTDDCRARRNGALPQGQSHRRTGGWARVWLPRARLVTWNDGCWGISFDFKNFPSRNFTGLESTPARKEGTQVARDTVNTKQMAAFWDTPPKLRRSLRSSDCLSFKHSSCLGKWYIRIYTCKKTWKINVQRRI